MSHFSEALILKAAQITEAAAIACWPWIGRGNSHAADQAAVDAMRHAMKEADINGTVVIGEGERDEAPMLYIGEQIGRGTMLDIAVDPLEGTTLCANDAPGAITVMALANRNTLLHAPDVYMEKITIGAGLPRGIVDLDAAPKDNLAALAKAMKVTVKDLRVTILDRPRHQEIIAKYREAGARVRLITDGDVMAALETILTEDTDMYVGTGGAPEGVLAAAAVKCLNGQMQGRLLWKNEEEKKRAQAMGITNLNQKYSAEDMVKGDVIFAATGVTQGRVLQGLSQNDEGEFHKHSIIISTLEKAKFLEIHS
jgi:fructose-1,6-bisphosphatase class II